MNSREHNYCSKTHLPIHFNKMSLDISDVFFASFFKETTKTGLTLQSVFEIWFCSTSILALILLGSEMVDICIRFHKGDFSLMYTLARTVPLTLETVCPGTQTWCFHSTIKCLHTFSSPLRVCRLSVLVGMITVGLHYLFLDTMGWLVSQFVFFDFERGGISTGYKTP